MIVSTSQMAKWKKVDALGLVRLDITVKTGDRRFAPTWDMVMGHKNGDPDYDDEGYTILYRQLMEESYCRDPNYWEDLLHCDGICLVCFCKACNFCHRFVLIDILEEMCKARGIDFDYVGEIE